MARAVTSTLVQFGFVSRPRGDLPEAAVRRLVRGASERNRRLGVTGELVYADGVLRKVMEGPCEAILVLASEILADERYESIEVTGFAPIEARRHAEWRVSGMEEAIGFRVLSAPSRGGALRETGVRPFAAVPDPRRLADRTADGHA